MKALLMTLALSFSVNVMAADAADDCAFNFKDFHSMLDKKAKYKKYAPEVKDNDKKIVTQEVRLMTGEEVIFEGGGCSHMNYSFAYGRLKQTKMIEIKQYIQYAIELLEKTPTAKENKRILIAALKNKKIGKDERNESGIYDLPCGDAQCELDLSQPKSLKVSYSFAL